MVARKLILLFTLFNSIYAQNGGLNTFNFMQFSNSARVEALGGYTLALSDDDATLGISNPASINISHHGQLNLNYVNYFADSDYGFSSYSHHFKKLGTFTGSICFANYGSFEYADAAGVRNGNTFSANDLLIQGGLARKLDSNFSVGANIKFAGSFLESYNAFGIALDLGVNYQNTAKGFGAGLVIENLGYQIKGYTQGNHESLPLAAHIGISKKLGHAPFRFSFTYHDLQRWDLTYFDVSTQQTVDPLTGQTIPISEPGFVTHFFHHIVIGTELLLSKNFHLRLGYDFKNRYELKPTIRPGTTGISWGVGFKVKKFKFSYGNSKYHFSGTSNHITISTQIGGKPKVDSFYIQD